MNFEIRKLNPESKEFLIDGEHVAYANHDDDGWSGMEKLESMFEFFATREGVVIEYTFAE